MKRHRSYARSLSTSFAKLNSFRILEIRTFVQLEAAGVRGKDRTAKQFVGLKRNTWQSITLSLANHRKGVKRESHFFCWPDVAFPPAHTSVLPPASIFSPQNLVIWAQAARLSIEASTLCIERFGPTRLVFPSKGGPRGAKGHPSRPQAPFRPRSGPPKGRELGSSVQNFRRRKEEKDKKAAGTSICIVLGREWWFIFC